MGSLPGSAAFQPRSVSLRFSDSREAGCLGVRAGRSETVPRVGASPAHPGSRFSGRGGAGAMSRSGPRILLVAGEASGDRCGALLVRALRSLDPRMVFTGIGGPRMREEKVELFADSRDLAVVGLTEVLAHWKPIRAAFHRAAEELRRSPPDLLLLIDYPDFNLRLARKAKRCGVRVVYFISPQVWAWRKSRVRTIARNVAKMLVILPFEEVIYRRAGVPVEFVGHPLL